MNVFGVRDLLLLIIEHVPAGMLRVNRALAAVLADHPDVLILRSPLDIYRGPAKMAQLVDIPMLGPACAHGNLPMIRELLTRVDADSTYLSRACAIYPFDMRKLIMGWYRRNLPGRIIARKLRTALRLARFPRNDQLIRYFSSDLYLHDIRPIDVCWTMARNDSAECILSVVGPGAWQGLHLTAVLICGRRISDPNWYIRRSPYQYHHDVPRVWREHYYTR